MMRGMSSFRSLSRISLPSVSYGPFRQIGAVPWLLLAALMRVVAFGGGLLALPAILIADVALLMAFVIVTWRMILMSRGQTDLGQLKLAQQLKMTRAVLVPVFVLLIVAAVAAGCSGLFEQPQEFMLGFDGIAFDQRTHFGRLWSALVAALVLMMVLQVDESAKPSLFGALRQFGQRAGWLVPGVLLVAAISILLHPVQGWFRMLIRDVWFGEGMPTGIKALLFFSFVVIFATVRLWLTVAVLVFALRQSYRVPASG